MLSAPARLAPEHDLSRFDCGSPPLNDWLKRQARTSEGRTARTYVVCDASAVVGYHCIAAGSVERRAAPRKLKQNAPDPIPVAILGRLAVDLHWRGQGLGTDLLHDAFRRIVAASETIGFGAVLVHAIDDEARAFYLGRAEFLEYPPDSRILFLPLQTLIDAL